MQALAEDVLPGLLDEFREMLMSGAMLPQGARFWWLLCVRPWELGYRGSWGARKVRGKAGGDRAGRMI